MRKPFPDKRSGDRLSAKDINALSEASRQSSNEIGPGFNGFWRAVPARLRSSAASQSEESAALFHVAVDLPARDGDTLGSALARRRKIVDGKLKNGPWIKIYNATDEIIKAIDPPFGETYDPDAQYCDPAIGNRDLYVICTKVDGHWLATMPLYPLVATTVGTGLSLTDDDLRLARTKMLAFGSECTPDTVDLYNCL